MSSLNDVVVALLKELERRHLIDITEVMTQLFSDVDIVDYKSRANYEEIAEMLKEGKRVFLPIDRKLAYYATRRLQELTGCKVHKIRVEYNRRKGYIFTL